MSFLRASIRFFSASSSIVAHLIDSKLRISSWENYPYHNNSKLNLCKEWRFAKLSQRGLMSKTARLQLLRKKIRISFLNEWTTRKSLDWDLVKIWTDQDWLDSPILGLLYCTYHWVKITCAMLDFNTRKSWYWDEVKKGAFSKFHWCDKVLDHSCCSF